MLNERIEKQETTLMKTFTRPSLPLEDFLRSHRKLALEASLERL